MDAVQSNNREAALVNVVDSPRAVAPRRTFHPFPTLYQQTFVGATQWKFILPVLPVLSLSYFFVNKLKKTPAQQNSVNTSPTSLMAGHAGPVITADGNPLFEGLKLTPTLHFLYHPDLADRQSKKQQK